MVRALASEPIGIKDGLTVKQGPTQEIFEDPKETYTQALIAAAFHIETLEDSNE